ncbi:MAG: Ig-like domain-containing protein [Acidobacteriia bacterium]|nr:Ig-like domain-containing protein [Terriglobia bacterium]
MKSMHALVVLVSVIFLPATAGTPSVFCQTKPTVVATNPPNGATGVSPDITSITITFSKAMNTSSWGGGVGLSNWLAPEGNAGTWSADQKTLTYIRRGVSPQPMNPSTNVIVYLNSNPSLLQYGLKDTEGNLLDPYVFSFTIYSQAALEEIRADPQKGFSWPYYLRTPNSVKQPAILLVEPNNTGTVNDDPAVHNLAAKNEALAWAMRMDELGCPYLIPTFPRPASHAEVYTQALDRNTLVTKLPDLERIDLQLLAMIDDARSRLAAKGINVDSKVFMMGFSASGQFTSRFVLLHPDRIQAASIGSPGFGPTVPVAQWKGITLPYQVGVADVEQLTGQKFDVAAFRQVPLQIYVGDMDTNIVPWYLPESDSTVVIIEAAFGGDGAENFWRWANFEAAYASVQSSSQFVVFPGMMHVWADWSFVKDFFERNRATPPPPPLPRPYLYALYFPHSACGDGWQTEIAITNTGEGASANGELSGFNANGGQPLEKVTLSIPPAGRKEINICGFFAQAPKIDYLSFVSDTGFVAGYTRFWQPGLRASLGATTGSRNGWFLKVEQEGWTGIAFVNVETTVATITASAVDENGKVVGSETFTLAPGKKYVAMVTQLFRADITQARYFKFGADRNLVGFTISSSADGMMLDGLPSMPQFSRYLGRQK